MKSSRCSRIIAVSVLIGWLLITLVGCSSTTGKKKWYQWPWGKKTVKTEEELPPPPEAAPSSQVGEVSSVPMDQKSTEEQISLPEPTPLRQPARPAEESELSTVYFDFDKSDLSAEAKATLDNNARWLTEHPEISIQIEGHTDIRGTLEYNFNLGQRRANAVKDYLIGTGINSERLHTISYGEERPVDPNESEEAYAKNRRAQFLIY